MNLIKKLRINAEKTQAELAAACGVSQGTVALWEHGKAFPRSGKIGAVAAALGCDPADLLREAENRNEKEAG